MVYVWGGVLGMDYGPIFLSLTTALFCSLVDSLVTWCGVGGLILRKPYFPKTAGTAAQP